MKIYHFKSLFLNEGWLDNATVTVDAVGNIVQISEASTTPDLDNQPEYVNGYAIPSVYNAHSHAFQYAMAGLAEKHSTNVSHGDFWSWREAMYKLALSVDPDQMEAIATMLYAEMVRHGYSQVAEFHYVHHDKDGNVYSNLSEMGERMISAAKNAGIRITLIPIFYQKGGFGMDPNDGQKRFISSSVSDYLKLWEASQNSTKHYDKANIALGIHSMRGVDPKDILNTINAGDQSVPFHIHISEQLKEIEDCKAYLGKRPVEWLCDNAQLSARFQLVHATHLTDQEVQQIAQSKAQVVICPSTEGNLGDGIFPLRRFQELDGTWCIGTDSHIGINPMEDLRILDYGQRLISHKRNTFTSDIEGNSAHFAFDMITNAGRIAGGRNDNQYFEVGKPLDALILDGNQPLLDTASAHNRMNTILYASDSSWNLGTMVAGEWKAKDGKHLKRDEIQTKFVDTLNALKSR